jgi:hypothetical protein
VSALLLLYASLAAAGLPWPGGIVHPGCVRELRTELADSAPIVAAVDLEGCSHSNKYPDAAEIDGSTLRWREPESEGKGYFQYEYLGALSNGVHVLRTAESGGGSGVFQDLLFVRIVRSAVMADGSPRVRHALTLVGSETLGDRARVTVTLSGAEVSIRRQEFRGAAGYGPEVTIVRRPQ